MNKIIINTSNAPAPIGPYSQAVQIGDLLFVSGQIAINPATGNIENDNITKIEVYDLVGKLILIDCPFSVIIL